MELRVPHGFHCNLILFEMSRMDHVLYNVLDVWIGSLEAQIQFVCVFEWFRSAVLEPLCLQAITA